MDIAFYVSIIIFTITFVLILSERVHRTVISFFGATAMIVVGMMIGFYHPDEALDAIDFNTIGLLFGMMIVVAIMERTGVFQYLGIFIAKKTKGSPWLLIAGLGTLTSGLSMILDNVTTIILIVPVTIIIARIIKINPAPILIAEVLLSNIGGVGTLVGDPPNIMIGSAAGFGFNIFLTHSLPIVIVAWFATLATLRFVYRKEIKEKPSNMDELMKMDEREAIKDKSTLKKSLFVLGLVVVLFFLHSTFHMPPAMVALIGAALLLIMVTPTKDPQKILEKTELSVLLFFASLFVIVGGLEHAGVLQMLAELITYGASDNIILTALAIMWASAVISSIVDNIPMTVAMLPIITYLGVQGVDINLLWWALVFGVGFGGNGSPIGASSNIIAIAKSEQTDNPITFKQWFKAGTSTMFVSLTVATFFIIIFADFLAA